jgi:hypothetical protein
MLRASGQTKKAGEVARGDKTMIQTRNSYFGRLVAPCDLMVRLLVKALAFAYSSRLASSASSAKWRSS